MTHSVTPLAASWRYRRGKCQQPCMGSEKKNHSGRLCPLFEQRRRGGERGVGGEGWGVTRGRGDKREEVSHSCPAWGPKYVALSSSQRHQPSVLACHYFTSRRARMPSLRHTYAHLYHHIVSLLPWSTLKFCQQQKKGLSLNEKNIIPFFCCW